MDFDHYYEPRCPTGMNEESIIFTSLPVSNIRVRLLKGGILNYHYTNPKEVLRCRTRTNEVDKREVRVDILS